MESVAAGQRYMLFGLFQVVVGTVLCDHQWWATGVNWCPAQSNSSADVAKEALTAMQLVRARISRCAATVLCDLFLLLQYFYFVSEEGVVDLGIRDECWSRTEQDAAKETVAATHNGAD
jgi:hypothetical protein